MSHRTLFPVDLYTTVDPLAQRIRDGFLLAYRGNTRLGYETDLRLWFRWCADHNVPVLEAVRVNIETYLVEMEAEGLSAATRQRRLVAIAGYYRYAEEEEHIAKSPARHVRRPRVPDESTSSYLDRYELGAYLAAAEQLGARHAALCCLLALNGLRVTEACSADVDGLNFANGHRTLTIVRKGGREADVPLAPQTFRHVLQAADGRGDGPLLLNRDGERMSRHNATRIVRAVARKAGIIKRIGPHSLRHSFVSNGLDAGVPLRDMQTAAGHRHVNTTTRYDRRDRNLDRHAAYVVAAYVGGG